MRSIIGSVAPPPPDWAGPPLLVMNNGCANRLNEAIIVVMMINIRTGRSIGIVTYRRRCHHVAPSMDAASCKDAGMFWSAARMMIMLKPLVHQTVVIRIAIHAHGMLDSQRG